MNRFVILGDKRAEIAGRIAALKKQIARHKTELAKLDGVIRPVRSGLPGCMHLFGIMLVHGNPQTIHRRASHHAQGKLLFADIVDSSADSLTCFFPK